VNPVMNRGSSTLDTEYLKYSNSIRK